MNLSNSKRVLLSANYVTIALSDDDRKEQDQRPGRAIEKLNFLRALDATVEDLSIAAQTQAESSPFSHFKDALRDLIGKLKSDSPQSAYDPTLAQNAAKVPYNVLLTL